MAAPTFVAAGAQVDGLGSVTPPNPSGLATDDLKLIFISDRMSPGTDLSTVVPSGWTLWWRLERTAGHEAACYYQFHAGQSAPTITASSDDLIAEMVAYRGVEFYLHLDCLLNPATEGFFLEVKSRTWSRRDARDKAAVITELLARFGASPDDTLSDGYVQLVAKTDRPAS